MSTSMMVIKFLIATPNKDKKKIIVVLLSIFLTIIICFLMVFYIISPTFSTTFESVISDIKEQRLYENDLNASGVRAIYLLYYNKDVPNYSTARAFINTHFIVKGKRRFKTTAEILDYIQEPPFNFGSDYFDLVYYAFNPYMLFLGGGNNSDSGGIPPNSGNENAPSRTLPKEFFGTLTKPCSGRYTSMWGGRYHPVTGEYDGHTGIDIQGTWHQPIYSTARGIVVSANTAIDGYGNYIKIKHTINGTTFYSFYAHMSRLSVNVGEVVEEGQMIGYEGGDPNNDINPGTSTGHHLHFEIRLTPNREDNIDPYPYFKIS